jgi:hypothetical protein
MHRPYTLSGGKSCCRLTDQLCPAFEIGLAEGSIMKKKKVPVRSAPHIDLDIRDA